MTPEEIKKLYKEHNGVIDFAEYHKYKKHDLAIAIIEETIGLWMDHKKMDRSIDTKALSNSIEIITSQKPDADAHVHMKYPHAAGVSALSVMSDKEAEWYVKDMGTFNDMMNLYTSFFYSIPDFTSNTEISEKFTTNVDEVFQRYLASYATFRAQWGNWRNFTTDNNDHLNAQAIRDLMEPNFKKFVDLVWSEAGGMKMSDENLNCCATYILSAINHSLICMYCIMLGQVDMKKDQLSSNFKGIEDIDKVVKIRKNEYANGMPRLYPGGSKINQEMYDPLYEYMNKTMYK